MTVSLLGCSQINERIDNVSSRVDANFKSYLLDNFDTDSDGEISEDEALAVKEIDIAASRLTIRSLSGIEYFKNLEKLDCSYNSLTSLELSGLTKLRELNASSNTLESLNLSGCASLTSIDCSKNRLQTLAVSGSPALETLVCEENKLVSLNIAQNQSLKRLDCSDNSIAALDLSNCRLLEELDCSGNALSVLDVKNNTALKTLDVSGNRDISLVDLRNNPALEDLNASGLSISELDLTAITQLKTLDVTDNASLTRVICPSQEWLCKLLATSDIMLFEDKTGNSIIGGSVKIDGKYWACGNFGYTSARLYGDTYIFNIAQKVCPDGWRTPTKTELWSLSQNYSSVVTVNGMRGRWFSGSKKYSSSVPAVFLPYGSGYSYGSYWSSTSDSGIVYLLRFSSSKVAVYATYDHSITFSVRCVKN